MSNLLTVSPSPHVYSDYSIKKLMYGVLIALIPALAVSLYFYGIGALIVSLTAVASAVFFEYVITKYLLKKEPSIMDGSAVITGLLLAFNVPSNLPVWIIIIGSLVAIGMAKMSFGGLGNNPFNPALIGRVFLLISFPAQMTIWPEPAPLSLNYIDVATGATPLGVLGEGGMAEVQTAFAQDGGFTLSNFALGYMGGSLGEISAIALIIGLVYMLIRKIVTWHIPISILATVFVFTGILWLIDPNQYADPVFHLFTGGLMLGAIFMATDYVTSPMTAMGMLIYGIAIGIITVVIRVWGSYPEGVSFAILIGNLFTPIINKYVKPKRFGEVVKK